MSVLFRRSLVALSSARGGAESCACSRLWAALSGVFSQAVALAWDANKHLGDRGGARGD